MPAPKPDGLRERKKLATRRAIQDQALRLFLEKGYDATTVDEIAAAAGISPVTFFRYFTAKHAVVQVEGFDPVVAELITARPPEEPALVAVRRAFAAGLREVAERDRDAVLVGTRLVLDTPALRARMWEDEQRAAERFAAALAPRLDAAPDALRVRALAAAVVTTVRVALVAWVDGGGRDDLADLVDDALAALAG